MTEIVARLPCLLVTGHLRTVYYSNRVQQMRTNQEEEIYRGENDKVHNIEESPAAIHEGNGSRLAHLNLVARSRD